MRGCLCGLSLTPLARRKRARPASRRSAGGGLGDMLVHLGAILVPVGPGGKESILTGTVHFLLSAAWPFPLRATRRGSRTSHAGAIPCARPLFSLRRALPRRGQDAGLGRRLARERRWLVGDFTRLRLEYRARARIRSPGTAMASLACSGGRWGFGARHALPADGTRLTRAEGHGRGSAARSMSPISTGSRLVWRAFRREMLAAIRRRYRSDRRARRHRSA